MKKRLLSLTLLLFLPIPAFAQVVAPLDLAAKQAYLADVETGTPLYAKDADSPMNPSSLTKMMTMYLVFEAIKDGKLKKDDMLPVSEHAWKQEGSRTFLKVGTTVKVEDLIQGVIVQSGNDAAVTLAEGLGAGSESAFADMMNEKAKQLGMKNTHFVNATGLPDPQHYTTAHDLAILAEDLIRDFPDEYHYFSETEFTYNNIKQGNRNPLLYRNMNVDGLKTGHTEAGGYGLAASVMRNGQRLVLVLNGMKSMQDRADVSAQAIDWGYREYGRYPVVKVGDKMGDAPVFLGKAATVPALAAKDVVLVLPRSAGSAVKTEATFDQPIPAPVKLGQEIGKLTITAPGMEPQTVPLLAANDVERLGFFARMGVKIKGLLGKKE